MLGAFRSLGRIFVDLVFPRICCGCDERIIEQGRIVCSMCERSMRPLRLPLCPRCGAENAPSCADSHCPSCPCGEIYFENLRAVTPYAEVASLIVEKLKYHQRPEYAEFMAPHLARIFIQYYAAKNCEVIVPVPLHPTRRRERGYNQSELLARHLAPLIGLPCLPQALARICATPSQTHLGRREREKNVRNAFVVRQKDFVEGRVVLLVDDVATTGATLNACARVLRESGARAIYALCFCRATLQA